MAAPTDRRAPGNAGGSPEQALIRRVFAPLSATVPGADALRDDAALLTIPEGMDLVITKDLIVAGVHFLPDDSPDLVARKALRVNVSDLAAKGARTYAYLVGLALPAEVDEDWLVAFASGLAVDQEEFGCGLAGGDMTRTGGTLTVSVTAMGLVPCARIVRRNTARPNDRLYVSGSIGDAVLGLALQQETTPAWARSLSGEDREYLVDRYRLPKPRSGLADTVGRLARAAMDISDGLAGDISVMCTGSGVGARIVADDVPLSAAARAACAADDKLFARLVGGGDDYEILCAIAPDDAAAFEAQAAAAGVAVTLIGTFDGAIGDAMFVDRRGAPLDLPMTSYSHF